MTPAQILRARGKLGPYTTPGRDADPVPAESVEVDRAAVRAWAAQQGIEVAARGPIPATVIDAYHNREDT